MQGEKGLTIRRMQSPTRHQHVDASTTSLPSSGSNTSACSPLRFSKRAASPDKLSSGAMSASPNDMGGAPLTSPPSGIPAAPSAVRSAEIAQVRAQGIRSLKSHSLVSNSPFRQPQAQAPGGSGAGALGGVGSPAMSDMSDGTNVFGPRRGTGLGISDFTSSSVSSSTRGHQEQQQLGGSRLPRTNSGFTPRKLSDEVRNRSTPSLFSSSSSSAAAVPAQAQQHQPQRAQIMEDVPDTPASAASMYSDEDEVEGDFASTAAGATAAAMGGRFRSVAVSDIQEETEDEGSPRVDAHEEEEEEQEYMREHQPPFQKVEAVYQPPRKSMGFQALQSASRVTNSPFKSSASSELASSASGLAPASPSKHQLQQQQQQVVEEKPLLPRNAWATAASLSPKKEATPQSRAFASPPSAAGRMSPTKFSSAAAIAAAANARPHTPERQMASTMGITSPTTPTSTPRRRVYQPQGSTVLPPLQYHQPQPLQQQQQQQQAVTVNGSPTGKGLLVNNRLHGPRSPPSAQAQGAGEDDSLLSLSMGVSGPGMAAERRKTVTFDEMLEVQEFDKESSFDGSSTTHDDDYGRESVASGESSSTLAGSDNDNDFDEDGDDASLPDVAIDEDGLQRHYNYGKQSDLIVQRGNSNARNGASSSSALTLGSAPPQLLGGVDAFGSPLEIQMLSFGSSTQAKLADPELRVVNPDQDPRTAAPGSVASSSAASASSVETTPELAPTPALSSAHASDPEDEDVGESSGSSSRDFSVPSEAGSVGEPRQRYSALHTPELHSLPMDETSFAASFHESFSMLGARDQSFDEAKPQAGKTKTPEQLRSLHRVDSMVDQLLQEELLVAPRAQEIRSPSTGRALPKPPTAASAAAPATTPPGSDPSDELATPTRNGSSARPRINRNAILERVAREKQSSSALAAAAALPARETIDTDSPMRSSRTETQLDSAPATRQRKVSDPMASTPTKAAATRSAAEMYAEAAGAHGPTEADEHKQTQDVRHTAPAPAPIPIRRDSLPSEVHRLSPLERVGELEGGADTRLNAPHVPDDDDLSDISGGNISGRVSPSLLGPAHKKVTPGQQADHIIARRRSKNGKSAPRRSLSTGDAAALAQNSSPSEVVDVETRRATTPRLTIGDSLKTNGDGGFGNGLQREISRIYRDADLKYNVKDRGIFQGAEDKVSHHLQAGDVDSGKAWRKLRRPSDMVSRVTKGRSLPYVGSDFSSLLTERVREGDEGLPGERESQESGGQGVCHGRLVHPGQPADPDPPDQVLLHPRQRLAHGQDCLCDAPPGQRAEPHRPRVRADPA